MAEWRSRARDAYTLSDLGIFSGSSDPSFDTIVDLTARVVGAPMVALKVFDERTDTYRVRAARGLPDDDGWQDRTTPLSALCIRIRDGEPVVSCNNLAAEPALSLDSDLGRLEARSFLGAPVRGPDDGPAGALVAIDRTPRIWSSEEKRLIEGLAALATQRIVLRAALETVRILARKGAG